jgi:hypothetical protein
LETRLKLLLMVSLASSFLLTLLDESFSKLKAWRLALLVSQHGKAVS